jgi:hypothetical protein
MPSKPFSTHLVRPLSGKDERVLRRSREICLALPETQPPSGEKAGSESSTGESAVRFTAALPSCRT